MSSSVPMFQARSAVLSMSRSVALFQNSSAKQFMKVFAVEDLAPQEEATAQEDQAAQVQRKSMVMERDLRRNKSTDQEKHMAHQVVGKVVEGQVDGLGEAQVDLQNQVEEVMVVAQVVDQVTEDHLGVEAVTVKVSQSSNVAPFSSSNVRVYQDNSVGV